MTTGEIRLTTVFEVIEHQRGVARQDPEKRVSRGLYGNRARADRERRRLKEQGVRFTTTVERDVLW